MLLLCARLPQCESQVSASEYRLKDIRNIEPIDIANLALFLASDDSKFVNGAIIPADAGWRAA